MDRRIAIGIGILILVGLGFMFISNITGNIITGSALNNKVVKNEYFKIGEFGNKEVKEVKNDTQNNSRSR